MKYHACQLQTEHATYARRRTLERTHVKHAGKGSKHRRVLCFDDRPDTVRSRAARAMPGCGREAWTKHHSTWRGQHEPSRSKHADACLMCLCCSGVSVLWGLIFGEGPSKNVGRYKDIVCSSLLESIVVRHVLCSVRTFVRDFAGQKPLLLFLFRPS